MYIKKMDKLHKGKDIDGKSYSISLKDLQLSGTIRNLMIGRFQPGVSYGDKTIKDKTMYIEGENIILHWIPNTFWIDMNEGNRYLMTWVGNDSPPNYQLTKN